MIIFIAPKIFGQGLNAFNFSIKKEIKFSEIKWENSGKDMVCNLRF